MKTPIRLAAILAALGLLFTGILVAVAPAQAAVTVSFRADNAMDQPPTPINANEGDWINLPDDLLMRDGYWLSGWSPDPAWDPETGPGPLFTGGDPYQVPAGGAVLYAKWTPTPKYTVTFYSHDGKYEAKSGIVEYATTTAPATTPTRDGYTFAGWSATEQTGDTPNPLFDFTKTMITANRSLYAQWTRNNVKVTFNANGGVPNSEVSVPYNTQVGKPSPDPTKPGHTFRAWTLDEQGTTPWDFDDLVTDDMTLWAQWYVNPTVTFDSQGGSPVLDETVPYSTQVNKPSPDPTKPGHTFAGWTTDEDGATPWDFNIAVTEDLTLYAQWTLNTYTVTFDSASGSDVPPVTVDHGTPVAVPADPTRAGYAFAGWSLTAQSGPDPQPLFDFTTPITGPTTLHAQWLQEFEVTFDSNGGTTVPAQMVPYTRLIVEPQVSREGYTLDGWYLDPEPGTLAAASARVAAAMPRVAADGKWDFATDQVTGPMTLHARWTAIPVPPGPTPGPTPTPSPAPKPSPVKKTGADMAAGVASAGFLLAGAGLLAVSRLRRR